MEFDCDYEEDIRALIDCGRLIDGGCCESGDECDFDEGKAGRDCIHVIEGQFCDYNKYFDRSSVRRCLSPGDMRTVCETRNGTKDSKGPVVFHKDLGWCYVTKNKGGMV